MPDLDWIRAFCLAFPDATENMQWGEDLCFKIRGKIFATVVLSDGKFPRVCFKCSPERFQELLEIDGISPAPYVGRHKWVLLRDSNVLSADELETSLRKSYEMVVANAPKKTGAKKSSAVRHGTKRRSRK